MVINIVRMYVLATHFDRAISVVLTTLVELLWRMSREMAKKLKGLGKTLSEGFPLCSRRGFTLPEHSHGPSLLGTAPLA